jgi:pimeloyl-ACP methyl ester carboxylesterase
MAYANNDGIRIHYRVEGSGPPLVLHHWMYSDLEWWADFGYVHALKDSATLLLVDSRGHGSSDKPKDPNAYSLATRVQDVVCVLDKEGIKQAHFCGFSMGGWIGYGMAIFAPSRICSLGIGGAHPYAQSLERGRALLGIGETEGPQAFVDAWETSVAPLTTSQRERMLAYDYPAMIAAAGDRENLEACLQDIQTPCVLFVGEEDAICAQVRRAADSIPRAGLITVPGKDHGATIRDCEHVVPLVRQMIRNHPC